MKSWLAGIMAAIIAGVTIYWLTTGINKPELPSGPLLVTITSPLNNSVVDVHDKITGLVSNRNARVWLIIQPVLTQDCWVQKPVIIDADGSWTASVQFGEDTPEHSDSPYEVRALANPQISLAPGPVTCWPDAEVMSKPLYVKRR